MVKEGIYFLSLLCLQLCLLSPTLKISVQLSLVICGPLIGSRIRSAYQNPRMLKSRDRPSTSAGSASLITPTSYLVSFYFVFLGIFKKLILFCTCVKYLLHQVYLRKSNFCLCPTHRFLPLPLMPIKKNSYGLSLYYKYIYTNTNMLVPLLLFLD